MPNMEYAKQGIRVNGVAPGIAETAMHKDGEVLHVGGGAHVGRW